MWKQTRAKDSPGITYIPLGLGQRRTVVTQRVINDRVIGWSIGICCGPRPLRSDHVCAGWAYIIGFIGSTATLDPGAAACDLARASHPLTLADLVSTTSPGCAFHLRLSHTCQARRTQRSQWTIQRGELTTESLFYYNK
jgi:hypothetical protein